VHSDCIQFFKRENGNFVQYGIGYCGMATINFSKFKIPLQLSLPDKFYFFSIIDRKNWI
jgi:hypothetical protein